MQHRATTLLAGFACVLAAPASAAFLDNSTGLANPQQTNDFDSMLLAHDAPVTTEFQNFGVISDPAFGNPDASTACPNIVGNRIGNFAGSGGTQGGVLTITYSGALSQVAFAMVTAPGMATLQALLNGVLVESATHDSLSPADSTNNFGFQGIVFDQEKLRVASFDNPLMVHNLQTVAAVPEPQTWALFLSGLALVSWFARRRT